MGKILESIGVIDGYDIIAIGKFKAKKDELFDEILKYDSKVKDETRQIVNTSSGRVFAITKKGLIKGIYLFEVETKEDMKNLKHIKTVYSDKVAADVQKKYDVHILNIAKDYVAYQEYDKVTLEDKVVQIDPKKTKKEKTIAMLSGFALGFILGWIIFDVFFLGIIYGMIFAPIFSGIEVVITNKRGRKKKDDK